MEIIGGVRVGGRNPVRIMGIINASPESFYKKSVHAGSRIRDVASRMEGDGADFVDVGGMSTAPYIRAQVSESVEKRRVLGAVRAVQDATNLPVSVDTHRGAVARAALECGAEIINDVTGLRGDESMRDAVKEFAPSVVLCAHHSGTVPAGIGTVRRLLRQSAAVAKGCGASGIALDPAIGFFRRTGRGPYTRIRSDWAERDAHVIRNLGSLAQYPVVVSVSNKSFLGKMLDRKAEDRLAGSLAAEAVSVINGASIIRTHNVRESRDAAAVARQLG